MDSAVGVVTETWFSDGVELQEDIEHLSLGTGLRMLCKKRPRNDRGFSHGGVGLLFKESAASLKEIKMHNPENIEVLMAAGKLHGYGRKLAVIGCYIPPNYTVGKGKKALDFISGAVMEAKRKFDDPLIIVTGDFNQWDVARALQDFPDIHEVNVGPTRGDRSIDRIFVNVPTKAAGTLPPLESDPGGEEDVTVRKSDHKVAYCSSELPRTQPFKTLSYSYRYYNPESEAQFGAWLASQDWAEVLGASTSNEKTNLYQKQVTGAQDRFFPLITVNRRSTEPPWYNWNIKKKIKQKKGIYRREGRSPKWRRMKVVIERLISKRRENYATSQKDALLAHDGERNFFKNVRSYKSSERSEPFNVSTLFPGKSRK